MLKYYCDMCDKELDYYSMYTLKVKTPEIKEFFDTDYEGDMHLCDKCMCRIINTIKRREIS